VENYSLVFLRGKKKRKKQVKSTTSCNFSSIFVVLFLFVQKRNRRTEKKILFLVPPVQVADSSVYSWNLDGSFSRLQSQMQKISFDKPTKDLLAKEVHSPWQKDALGVYNSFLTG